MTISQDEIGVELRRVIKLPATSSAPRLGREAARAALVEWGWPRVDDVELVCSELVTNAVVHTGTEPTLVLAWADDAVHLEVYDADHSAVIVKTPRAAPGALGLRVVSVVSDAWGWAPAGSGKVVWAVFDHAPSDGHR